ncbi:MAG: nucleotide exchange factor GrpE [Phycisphaerae bacterium]|nr:nucleotide exchange factor GrpE [Phycisphaerae bacterium]
MTTPVQPLSLAQEARSLSLETQRATLRDRLQRRFEVWLDEALNPEAVPQGLAMDILAQLDAEAPDSPEVTGDEDLQSVCAALVGLTETARSQGVALDQLHQDLPAMQTLAATVSAMLDSLAEDRKTQAEDRKQQEQRHYIEARRQVLQGVLGAVMGMRDRLREGLTEAQAQLDVMTRAAEEPAPRKRWWQMSSKTPPSLDTTPGYAGLEALIKANQLALTGIDHALTQWHVELIEAVGQPLNTATMKVVDQVPHGELAEGTVLKVLRAGYAWNGTLCRPAEVCVVHAPMTS